MSFLDRDLMLMRDKVGDLDSPKHGKIDPTGAPHVGGNTWAGGTGGRDTAGNYQLFEHIHIYQLIITI